jgi:shikimate kinase
MKLPPNIILVGFMGSGKTSTGKEIANLLNFSFLDTDNIIEEKNKKKVSDIFTEKGENYFRFQEKEVIDFLKNKKHSVISTGGGIWISEENRKILLKMGWCVWLKISAEKAFERIKSNLLQRPLISHTLNPMKKIEEMLSERIPLYSLAHISFETDKKSPREVALEIVKVLKEDKPFDLSEL